MVDDFNTALRHHQGGRLDEAENVYRAVLAQEPNHVDALHLLGVLLHQRGRGQEAIGFIHRAIAVKPSIAAFHANLAEVYRGLGQLDRAVTACRTALRLQPRNAEARNNLGLALLGQGRREEAMVEFREAITIHPRLALAHNNLGNALRESREQTAAIESYRKALECDPHLVPALNNLGQLLLERDEIEEALAHCEKAAQLGGHLAEVHNNLGNVLRELDRFEEARASYEKALLINPQLGLTHNNLAQAFQEQGRFDEAVPLYQKALELEPTSGRIHANFASCLEAQERYEEAVDRFRLALQFDPDEARTHDGLGGCLRQIGKSEEAVVCFREAIRLRPHMPAAHVHLGGVLEELGKMNEAELCFREALTFAPNHPGALGQLATLLRGQLPHEDRERIERLLNDPNRPAGRRAVLLHGLAHVLDGQGDYRRAAELLREGNALRKADWEKHGKAYDPEEHSRWVDRIIAVCDQAFFERTRGFGLESLRPIFIVGLPRSATTLTEQIVASHSLVFGAGELRLARESFESLPHVMGLTGPPIEAMSRLDRVGVKRVAQAHLDGLRALNADAARVADKMPENFNQLGLLAVLFPRATFIHTRRDLRDVAVSCWMTNFGQIRWANDPRHIAARFGDYVRLMDHWRKVLPINLLEIDYRDTVTDLDGVARKLIAHCGLEWEDQCLSFHTSQRPIRTASVTQVRQPIYTRSLDRWRNYAEPLAELFSSLPMSE